MKKLLAWLKEDWYGAALVAMACLLVPAAIAGMVIKVNRSIECQERGGVWVKPNVCLHPDAILKVKR